MNLDMGVPFESYKILSVSVTADCPKVIMNQYGQLAKTIHNSEIQAIGVQPWSTTGYSL